MKVKQCCLPLVAMLIAGGAWAQEYRGRIQGFVSDSSSGAIVGAQVTLENVKTGVKTQRPTNETGRYLFDMVEPGSYMVAVEAAGFSRFVQENIRVQTRGDVTVDAVLNIGGTSESITVSSAPTAVQFNSSKVELTFDNKLVQNLPQFNRNPFEFAQLDPSGEKQADNDMAPFNTWGASWQSVGGSASFSSDLQVDGSPVTIGAKTGYIPSQDAVQEVNVQQNAVDAEMGYSSGSAISIVMKSGTNEWHGDGFYTGNYPWANAMENRTTQSVNKGRNHMFGGTLGHPIKKNKIFNFFSYEQWKRTHPGSLTNTLPTDLERNGDFSQSLNVDGGLRTIYDPWSTVTGADGTVTRTPFPENKIPTSRQDPVAQQYMSQLWSPNRPGEGPYHLNNFSTPFPIIDRYHNLLDRVDYNINDKLRVNGRVSLYRTPVTAPNPTGSPLFDSGADQRYDSMAFSGDIVYALSVRTVINIHGDWNTFHDDAAPKKTIESWGKYWPNSDWYKPLFPSGIPVFNPRMDIWGPNNGTEMGYGMWYWRQHPSANDINVKIAQQRGSHYLKAGFETRAKYNNSYGVTTPGFGFTADPTADTYDSPNTELSGDPFATFLAGVVVPDGNTSMMISAVKKVETRLSAVYLNDDWKIGRNLTLNLGLRYEYEQPFRDPENRLPRNLDLTSPIPEMQQNAPQMPSEVSQYYTGGWTFNGAYQFTDNSHRGSWNSLWGSLSPRVGGAYRLSDKMSIRAAWAQYPTPWVSAQTFSGGHDFLDIAYPGYDSDTQPLDALQGVPRATLSNPYSTAYPLIQPQGKALGRYTNLGDGMTWVYENRHKITNSRFNVSFQRELPKGLVFDGTYYLNSIEGNLYNTRDLNMVDPRLSYQYKSALTQPVANPFFDYLTPDKFPGSLRYADQVSIQSLMRPYPQYGSLVVDQYPGGGNRFQSMQLRVQKAFSSGFSLLLAYNYQFQRDHIFYDSVDQYLQQYYWQDSNAARHRFSGAGTWELPFGKGRTYFANEPRYLDAVLGGWNLSSVVTRRSGQFIRFGALQVDGDPIISDPGPGMWFNKAAFTKLPAYTRRSNPRQYPGLNGPGTFNIDASLAKDFRITEKFKTELRMDAFNALNQMTWAMPNTNVSSKYFGQSTDQAVGTYGRRLQLGLKLLF